MRGFTIIVATILSTVIHFFIFTLLDTVPLISKEIPPQPNLYMVDLVPLAVERPAPQKEAEPAVQQKVEEVKKEEVKEVKKKEEVKKEEVKKTVPKEDKTVLADRSKEREKKGKTEKQPLDPEEQRLAAIERIRQNRAARNTDDAPMLTDAEKNDYKLRAAEKVAGFWAILNIWSEEGLNAKVIIEVDEKGQVTEIMFEQSSGNLAFDQAARRAISKAAPFPPPLDKKPIKIPLRFKSRQGSET